MEEIIQAAKDALNRLNSGKSCRVYCKNEDTAELIYREICTKTSEKVLYLHLNEFGTKHPDGKGEIYLFFKYS